MIRRFLASVVFFMIFLPLVTIFQNKESGEKVEQIFCQVKHLNELESRLETTVNEVNEIVNTTPAYLRSKH